MKSTNDKIDELLGEFYEESVDAYHAFMGTYTDAESDETAPDRLIKSAKQELAKLIKETLQECIDPMLVDIIPNENNPLQNHNKRLRKHYSQEALTKLEELLK